MLNFYLEIPGGVFQIGKAASQTIPALLNQGKFGRDRKAPRSSALQSEDGGRLSFR